MKVIGYSINIKIWLILIIYCIPNISYPQQKDSLLIDSLEKVVLLPHKIDSVYIEKLIKLNLLYVDSRNIKKDSLSFKVLNLSKKINYKLGIIAGLRLLSYQYAEKGDFVKALEYAHVMLDISKSIDSPIDILDSYNVLTYIYASSSNNTKALENATLAYEKINSLPKTMKVWYLHFANITISLSNIYSIIGQNQKSIKLLNEVISKMDESIKNNKLNFETAIYFKGVCYINLSSCYYNEKNYDGSIQNGEKALELSNKYNFELITPPILTTLTSSYIKQYQLDKARVFIERLKKYFNANQLQVEELKGYYEVNRDLNLAENNYKIAYSFQEKYHAINDSIRNKEVQNELNDLIVKYDVKEKEQLNIRLQTENERIEYKNKIAIISLIVTILIIILGIYFYQKLKKLNNKLDESNQIKTKLFSIIAHDIKAPVVSMYNFFDMFNYHIQKNNYDKIIELSNDAAIQSNQLNLSVENILRWSMLQQNIYKVNIRSIELNPVIMDVLDEFKFQIKKKNLLINYDNSMELKIVQCDFTILSILFRNIISNAIKFSNENGEIRIFNKDNALIIEDDGIGISKEDIYNIENGIQKNKSQRKNEGSGIGLSLCYDLAKKTNISLVIEQGKSKGTKMIIVFNNTPTPFN